MSGSSKRPAASRSQRGAFTLIEMLTTVAVLIIVLGLMVSLARYVRDRSANELTQTLLLRLEDLAREYEQRTGRAPQVPPILAADDLSFNEASVQATARLNNAKFVEVMKGEFARSGLLEQDRSKGGFGDLPISLYNGRILADAWGNPIVFMPDQHPAIGMAPMRSTGLSGSPTTRDSRSGGSGGGEATFFLFSAGPDGRYLTREDNVYSYEQAGRK
jgi:type II secretory pathway pseudopilin PulG